MAYSLKNVLTQSPEKVKVTVLAVGGVICALIGLDATVLETVGIGIAVERLLDLFYTAPLLRQNADTKTLEAIDLGKKIGPDISVVPTGGITHGTIQAGSGGQPH